MPAPTGHRVLVVDDDERVRTVVSWQLEADGFTVHAGRRRRRRARPDRGTTGPDLVVLDLSLPGVGGLDVLRRVRSETRRHPRCR